MVGLLEDVGPKRHARERRVAADEQRRIHGRVPEGTAKILLIGPQSIQNAHLKQTVHKRATPLKISTGVHVTHGAVYHPGYSHRNLHEGWLRQTINRI